MKAILAEISELFKLAEEKIKLIENLEDGGLPLPAINQLRYVAFHLLRAENIVEDKIKDEELRKAKNHCQRAIYDAIEIGIIHLLDKIKVFQMDYKLVSIVDIVPSYIPICKRADEITYFLSEASRRSIEDHSNNRGDYYEKSNELFNELQENVKLLDYSRPELNKKLQKSRITFIISISALIASFLSVIIAIIAIIK